MRTKPTYEELERELEILKRKVNPQTLLDFSGILFVEINPKGIVTLVNNKTCEVFGYEEQEMVGENWFENFIPERTKKELLSISKKILSGEIEKVEHFENPILTKNKEERIISWHNTPIKDEKGSISGHLSLGEDITERKKIEDELIRLNTAVNRSIHEVHIFDADNLKFTFVNEVSIKNLGYTFEELKKMSPVDVTPEYEHKDALKKLAPLRNGKIDKLQFETFRQRKDKTTYPVEINVCKFYIQDKLYFLALIIDITERKKLEKETQEAKEKARESEEKFKQLSNLTFEGILIHDNGLVIDINLSLSKMLGYKPEELIGENIIDLFVPKKYHQIISKSIVKNYTLPFEIEGIKKDGSIIPIEIEARSFISENNRTYRVAAIRDITERKKTQVENIKLSTVVEQSSNTIIITDIKGNLEYVNSKFTEVTGYTSEEVLGKNTRFLNSGKYPKEIFTEMWQTILAGKTWKGEFLNKAKNGEYYWEYQTNTPIKNNTGKITNFLSIREDISSLKESELRLKTLLESSPNPIYFKDGEGRWLETNNAGLEMFNLQGVDYYGKTDRELVVYSKFYEESLLECERTDEIAWKQGKATECEKSVSNSEGVEKILNITKVPLFHHDNTRKGIITITNEITHLKKAEQELIIQNKELSQISKKLSEKNKLLFDSQRKFKNLFEQSPVSLWEEDFSEVKQLLKDKKEEIGNLKKYFDEHPDFVNECISKIKIFNVNKVTLQLLGVKTQEELIAHIRKTNSKKAFEVLKQELLAFASNKKEFKGETEFYRTDGKVITALIKSAIIDEKGTAIASVIDITSLKKAEQELIKAKEKAEEGNRLKTEFLNNMSHEIRTPMNGILGFSKLLSDADLTDQKRKYFVNIIQNSGNQLLHIIDDILEISRLGTNQVKVIESEVCLNDLLFELFSMVDIKAKDKKIPLYFKKGLSDEQSTLLTDKTKLVKIITNLLENALKFTNKGFIEFGYQLKGKVIEIYVKDTGIGIKPKNHELIFERFSQAEKELSKNVGGLGLGLSIAKENTELLGGEIRVESEMMEGATFFVTIPYKPVKFNAEITDQKVTTTNKKDECTILIAEDEEVNYLFIEILLIDKIKLPCKIIHAKNGQEAVELCKNNPDIKFVLMDIKMPRLNGHEATKQIKEFHPNLPIIAQTAYSTLEDKEIALSAGCDDFISKPINEEELKKILDKYSLGVTNNGNI